jgi:phosphoribosylformylglycinamidine cyclo-ligase
MGNLTGSTYVHGVDFSLYEAFKSYAIQNGRARTRHLIEERGFSMLPHYGSAQTAKGKRIKIVHLIETLGTQYRVAENIQEHMGKSPQLFRNVGYNAFTASVNDAATQGADPLMASMCLIVFSAVFFENRERWQALIDGFIDACVEARCVYEQGETAIYSLVALIHEFVERMHVSEAIVHGKEGFVEQALQEFAAREYSIECSIVGIIPHHISAICGDIEEGDVIIFFGARGLHTNGFSFVHERVIPRLQEGYLTHLGDGRIFGQALLERAYIYSGVVSTCLQAGIPIHHAVHITGKGWTKIMDAPGNFHYIIEELPRSQLLYDFIRERGGISDKDMHRRFNCGAGFAVCVQKKYEQQIIAKAEQYNIPAWRAGHVEKADDRMVYIQPKGISFYPSESLNTGLGQ